MPSLKDIRRRIASVKSTQKITRAMKLVSAAKFARANAAVTSARPYSKAFDEMVERLVATAGETFESPFLTHNPEKKALVAVLSTDRGFCGGLNSNLFKATTAFINQKRAQGVDVELITWGKRARMYAGKLNFRVQSSREKVLEKPTYQAAKELAQDLAKRFEEGEYDRVYVAFVEFRSALSQKPMVAQLLPLARQQQSQELRPQVDVIIEPTVDKLLPNLLKRVVAGLVYRYLLEASASEHGARMTAMDSATNNANEVLRIKKIQYNRARQAAITKELIEITSGAQAL